VRLLSHSLLYQTQPRPATRTCPEHVRRQKGILSKSILRAGSARPGLQHQEAWDLSLDLREAEVQTRARVGPRIAPQAARRDACPSLTGNRSSARMIHEVAALFTDVSRS
jgi:hypothetical protein